MWIQRGGCAIRTRVERVFRYEGSCARTRSSREGFDTQTSEERAWDRGGRVAMGAGWELLAQARTARGHCEVSHVRMAPRVM